MDNKYKALSYVSPKPINIKQRFGKLTLATFNSAEKTPKPIASAAPATVPRPQPTARSSLSRSRKSYTYHNPNNNDVRISDDSLLTDDESDRDEGPSDSERNKIINNILNSDDTTTRVTTVDNFDLSHRKIANNCDDEKSQFSEKLRLNDSDETNCNAPLLEAEMERLEISIAAQSAKKKSSTPLFSTASDTVVSRLSSQLDRLDINEFRSLPDDIKLRNSLVGRNSDAIKTEPPQVDNNQPHDTVSTNVSILTISSTVSDNSVDSDDGEDEEDESVVIILSSDEDKDEENGSSESEIENNVSSLSQNTNDSLNTQVKQKLSDFFNNIPSPESPARFDAASHKDNEESPQRIGASTKDNEEFVPETPENSEIIPETPENLTLASEAGVATPEPVINTDSSVVKMNPQVEAAPNDEDSLCSAEDDTQATINISTKIQINIQFSEVEKRDSIESEPEPENQPPQSLSPLPPQRLSEVSEHISKSSIDSNVNENDDENENGEKEPNGNKFVGLNKTNVVIDEEMEGILNELYGKEWQTPHLLEKCLSTKKKIKKQPTPQKVDELLIDDTDFSLFGKKINDELESTRLPDHFMPNSKNVAEKPKAATTKKKATTTRKKKDSPEKKQPPLGHPERRRLDFEPATRPTRQAALKTNLNKVCDPDTSDNSSDSDRSYGNCSDSDDLNFTINVAAANEISSDDEATKENCKDRRIGKLLDQFEYKKKPVIPGTPPLSYILPTVKPTGNSKRKLYTPQNYEGAVLEETTPPKPNRSRDDSIPEDDSLRVKIHDWIAIKNKKIDEVKKRDLFLTPQPVSKQLPSTTKNASKSVKKNEVAAVQSMPSKSDRIYGFLQSLDEKIPREFWHPDAIKYRDNYNRHKYELTVKLYEMYNEAIFKFANPVDVTWNKKLTTTAGRCCQRRKLGDRSARVELSEKVLTTAERLRCTLVHELCHAATWIYDGANGHGARWKAWAARSMKIFPELPKIGVCHAYDIEYKYTYKCMQCGAKQQTHSKSIKVNNKCCKFCYGKIEVFLNKKTRDGDVVHTPIRAATGFAKYVQENYKNYKGPGLSHADVMKVLGAQFRELAVDEQLKS